MEYPGDLSTSEKAKVLMSAKYSANQRKRYLTSDSPSNLRLRLYEFEKIGIDLVCMRGRHPVRKALVDLQRAILQELGGKRAGVGKRHDLVVLAVHHQHRNGNLLKVFGEVGLRQGLDAVILGLGPPHHSLPQPVIDHSLRDLRDGTVESVEGTFGDIAEELRAIGHA